MENKCTKKCSSIKDSQSFYQSESLAESQVNNRILTTPAQLIYDLKFMNQDTFQKKSVYEYLKGRHFDIASFTSCITFNDSRYSRNRLFKNDMYEVLIMCWKPGQGTAIHNHEGHLCFVSVLQGEISVNNYSWKKCDRMTRKITLEEDPHLVEAMIGSLSYIDEGDGIHKMHNDVKHNQNAVSIHIYSKPLSECVVYDLQKSECRTLELVPTNDFSKLY